MKILLIISTLIAGVFTSNPQLDGDKTVDVASSTINWTGKKVTSEHTGTITLKSGSLSFENDVLTGGTFVMDMTTITCTDLDGEWGQKLVGHLNNEDFFETSTYPTAEMTIVDIVNKGDFSYNITADLKIKGTSSPVTFDAVVKSDSAMASLSIDRTIYNIKYGSGSFFENLGDKAIDNEFTLDINLAY